MKDTSFFLREMVEEDHKNFLETADEEAGVPFHSDEKFGAVFLEGYDIEGQNVLRYRYDV